MHRTKYNIITFPGSNCDHDVFWAAQQHGADCEFVWHKDTALKNPDVVVLPGGFSYGDYLRCGAIAKFSNIMREVIKFAEQGGLVLGICNGFQILTEVGLLPGTLLMNTSLHFICQHQYIKIENESTPFTCEYQKGEVADMPIAHKDGSYYIDADGLKSLIDKRQIVFKYCDPDGNTDEQSNPNASLLNIASIINEKGNVLGLMPHPERAILNKEGSGVFKSINKWISENL
jgi:phosphoribosylformylglycinamidine synthase